ncbi:NmrA family NAD(P)-binding protein [Mucilaginibacter sp. KACC 22063]|uniref:NmrA family NAD(P)-binding protein n=1 Tax=Mucilaginibacter sp. KACC 22063 TaxID=3025666 RepID=UPI002365990D|nr:NAD(P)H-binding protein [Mucilaginibacter sp. KACC 22063]WDF56017.1 NAD(P)H-binding protein [Mucilaginibacter sp. KACC 22063]
MKIVVTGSLGNISKPLTTELIQKGHQVTVISSSNDRKAAIEALGARAAIGTMEDADFLAQTFTGADIVYVMETLKSDAFFDHSLDVIEATTQIGRNYKEAIERSGVKKIVHLSSIGADKGPGLLRFHYNVENILRELPEDVSIKFMRPVGFYYVLYQFIPMIKQQGAIFSNNSLTRKTPWVSPLDIAAVIAEEIEKPFEGRTIRYIASDEISGADIARTLGEAIGKPDLQWVEISDEQMVDGLLAAGMAPQTAKGYVEMNIPVRDGTLYDDFYQHKPVLGKVKLTDFAKDFAAAYQQNQ